MTSLTIQIPDELLERLQSHAQSQALSLDVLVRTVLITYIEEDLEDEQDPTVEEINALIKASLKDMEEEKLFDADAVLDELERELDRHDN